MADDTTCWECGKEMVKKPVEYRLHGISIGKFPALVCESCHETIFSEETSKAITVVAKQKGAEVTITPESKNKLTISV